MSKSWCVGFALFVSLPALAEPVRLGSVRLSDAPDRDVVALPGCDDSDNDPVTHLQMRVNDFEAEVHTLEVKFQNGDVQTLEVRNKFEPGSESRWIDLAGPARCIAQIRIGGDSNTIGRAPGRQAQIVFWGNVGEISVGQALEGPESHPVVAVAAAEDPHLLGKIRLSDKPDRDVIDLPACPEGGNVPVREIRLGVQDFRAEIDRVRVVFENGTDTTVEVRHVFEPGERSVWKELPGEARCIDKIIVLGDANTVGRRPGRQAEVRFFGR